jgi:hypothetical protein
MLILSKTLPLIQTKSPPATKMKRDFRMVKDIAPSLIPDMETCTVPEHVRAMGLFGTCIAEPLVVQNCEMDAERFALLYADAAARTPSRLRAAFAEPETV